MVISFYPASAGFFIDRHPPRFRQPNNHVNYSPYNEIVFNKNKHLYFKNR